MNPRRRRLLIPGLLLALLVVAAIASFSKHTGAAERDEPLSRMSDPRITESSGLARSDVHPDLVYTINDSGHELIVYAVRISTGETVGATRVAGAAAQDPEALGLRDGTLWIADTGDNRKQRDQVALISIPEPGPGDGTADGVVHPVVLDRPADVETLLIDPEGTMFLVTKEFGSGAVYRVVAPSPGQPTRAELTDFAAPAMVTDGAFSPDGSSIVLLSYLGAAVLDPSDWQSMRRLEVPGLKQYESLAFFDDRSALIGSEGADSPLYRIAVSAPVAPALAVPPGFGVVSLAFHVAGLPR